MQASLSLLLALFLAQSATAQEENSRDWLNRNEGISAIRRSVRTAAKSFIDRGREDEAWVLYQAFDGIAIKPGAISFSSFIKWKKTQKKPFEQVEAIAAALIQQAGHESLRHRPDLLEIALRLDARTAIPESLRPFTEPGPARTVLAGKSRFHWEREKKIARKAQALLNAHGGEIPDALLWGAPLPELFPDHHPEDWPWLIEKPEAMPKWLWDGHEYFIRLLLSHPQQQKSRKIPDPRPVFPGLDSDVVRGPSHVWNMGLWGMRTWIRQLARKERLQPFNALNSYANNNQTLAGDYLLQATSVASFLHLNGHLGEIAQEETSGIPIWKKLRAIEDEWKSWVAIGYFRPLLVEGENRLELQPGRDGWEKSGISFSGGWIEFPFNDKFKGINNTATLESWVKINRRHDFFGNSAASAFTQWMPSGFHTLLSILPNGEILTSFWPKPGVGECKTAPGIFPFDGEWHHIASSRTVQGTVRIFLDGKKVLEERYPGEAAPNIGQPIFIGDPQAPNPTRKTPDGFCVYSVRASSECLYTKDDFPPPPKVMELQPQTVFLANLGGRKDPSPPFLQVGAALVGLLDEANQTAGTFHSFFGNDSVIPIQDARLDWQVVRYASYEEKGVVNRDSWLGLSEFLGSRVVSACALPEAKEDADTLKLFNLPEAQPLMAYGLSGDPAGKWALLDKESARGRIEPPSTAGWLFRMEGENPIKPSSRSKSQQCLDSALTWLADHQTIHETDSTQGYWDCDQFTLEDKDPNERQSDGVGNPVNDVGVTALALQAMIGTSKNIDIASHPFREPIARAATWLINNQDSRGLFGEEVGHQTLYNHSAALKALATVASKIQSRASWELRPVLEKGAKLLRRARNPYEAWRYGLEPDGDNDTSVTAWAAQALVAVAELGLEDSVDWREGAESWFSTMTDPGNGRTGYDYKTGPGGAPARPEGFTKRYPAELSESLTAASLLSLVLIAKNPYSRDDASRRSISNWKEHPAYEILVKQVKLIERAPPRWEQTGETSTIDFYYWLYGARALHQLSRGSIRGSIKSESVWKEWQRRLIAALVPNQRQDGNFKGSWDPVGPWGSDGGRVYSTSMAALTLQLVED